MEVSEWHWLNEGWAWVTPRMQARWTGNDQTGLVTEFVRFAPPDYTAANRYLDSPGWKAGRV